MAADDPAPKLIVVGGGKMGEALLTGLVGRGWCGVGEVIVVEPVPARQEELRAGFPGLRVVDQLSSDIRAPGAVVAVKPQHVEDACRGVAVAVRGGRVLSIAAGVTLASLESWLDADVRVIRAMPNTPALVGAGASAIAPGSSANSEDVAWATEILSAVGIVHTVSEAALDAVTGLSGSGPAYVFLFAEALIEAGVLVGLPRDLATSLSVQTILGAAQLLSQTGEDPCSARAAVTSPGGTTAAGLRVLEQRALRAAILDAVAAATQRSRELGHQ